MLRSIAAPLVTALLLSVAPAGAEDRPSSEPVAPNAVVAKAWAKEAGGSSAAVRTLFVTYGVVQGLDMVSTVVARNRGAVEVNPVMKGSYAQGVAVKAAMGAVTMLAVRGIEKKSRKAAIITMIGANIATAAVVAQNMRVAKRLK